MKTRLSSLFASSVRDLLDRVNSHNAKYPNEAILREDIVDIISTDEGYFLLYFE